HQAMRHCPAPRTISIAARSESDGQRIILEVADNGPGIPAEIRARIFEAFFTTKAPGQGTGLGLSLCRGIIEEHGGTITVDSEPGRGTTFVITLPVIAAPAATDGPGATEAPAAVAAKTILIVD